MVLSIFACRTAGPLSTTHPVMNRLLSSELTDEMLFSAVRRGDGKAFDTLFLRYYAVLCAYAARFVEPEEGEETVQDVMVWFWENREMQVFDVSLKSYLFKAVKNRCLTLISRNELRQRAVSALHAGLQAVYEDPDFYVVEELAQRIEEALAALPASYREAFEMNRFRHMTYAEIAASLGVSSKTVDYRIQQALKLLRVQLKEYLPALLFLLP